MLFWKYIKDIIKEQSGESQNEQSSNEQNNESQNEQSSNDLNNESQNGQSSNEQNNESQNEQSSNEQNNESQNEQSSNEQNNEPQNEQLSNKSSNESQNVQPSNDLNNKSQNEQSSNKPSNEPQNEQSSNKPSNEPQNEQSSNKPSNEPQNEQSSNEQNNESQNEQSSNEQNNESQNEQSSNEQNNESQNEQSINELNNEPQNEQSSNKQNNESQNVQPSNEQNNESQNEQSSNEQNNESQNEQSSNDLNNNQNMNSMEFNPKDTLKSINNRKQGLQQLRDKLQEYAKRREEKLQKQNLQKQQANKEKLESIESKEEEYKLSDQTNKFLDKLKEIPSFENRDRGEGYSIDTEGFTELPDSLIRTLITKFLNQRFCKKNTDLNIRSNSLEKSKGFYKWEVKDVIVHLKTHQITRVLDDKYGYQYAEGKNENVPLSFYFDMSGSMSKHTNMLAVIAIELLKKDVKVLIGFNERVNVQIEKIDKNMDVDSLAKFLSSAGYYGDSSSLIKNSQVTYKFVNQNIDNYLIERKAEKCAVFADFDPRNEIINLSHEVKTYWFCFEDSYGVKDIGEFSGFCYKVRNANDIMNGLIKVNENRFEALIYAEEIKKQKEKEEKEKQKSKGGM